MLRSLNIGDTRAPTPLPSSSAPVRERDCVGTVGPQSSCSVSDQLRWPGEGRKALLPQNTEGFLMLCLEPVPRGGMHVGRENTVEVVRDGHRKTRRNDVRKRRAFTPSPETQLCAHARAGGKAVTQ